MGTRRLISFFLLALLTPKIHAQELSCSYNDWERMCTCKCNHSPWYLNDIEGCNGIERSNLNITCSLQSTSFIGLREVKKLYLSGTNILLSDQMFRQMTLLEHLDLSDNDIRQVRQEHFEPLKNLNYLDLSGNRIELPADSNHLSHLKDLHELRLLRMGGRIVDLPSVVNNHYSLMVLHISDANLTCEPRKLKNQYDIDKLTLSNCHLDNWAIRKLEDILKRFSRVYRLDLSYNQLKSLHYLIFDKMTNLKNLYLNHNQLTQLDGSQFSWNERLEKLYLAHNDLEKINYIARMNTRDIKTIDLSHNKLLEIPERAFESRTSLRKLDLSYNQLGLSKPIPNNTLPKPIWTNAMELNCSGNYLSELPNDFFTMNYAVLDLSNNRLTTLRTSLNARTLNLSNNSLVQMPVVREPNNNYTYKWDMSFNQIKELPSEFFNTTYKVHMKLRGNKIACSELDRLMLNKNITLDMEGLPYCA